MPRIAFLLPLLFAPIASAAEPHLLPPSVRLIGTNARQRFLVEDQVKTAFVADRTATAAFSTDNPAVATVAPDGTVTPVANGDATLTAHLDGQSTRASIHVENMEQAAPWTFNNHVEPILTRFGCNSGACHGAAAGKNGFRLSLRGYAPEVDYNVLTRQASNRRIVPSAPAESLLLLKPTGALEHGGGVKFSTDSPEYHIIAGWIAAGSPAPSPQDPKLTALEVFPPAVQLKPGQTQQLLVRALSKFSRENNPPRTDDVTRWAKFASTDDTVATVNEAGQVKVQGHGEASIAIMYATEVQRATITVPYETAVDPSLFQSARRENPIDDHNLAKLEALHIPPSPDAGDAPFLRRAYLDATGALPPAAEVEPFLADKDPKKRAKLINRLLDSPSYVDYWTYKWSDLFLVSSNKLPAPAMWAFSRFVRQAVADNTPWDKFARSIITAKGNTLKNGAANYFVLHRDPIDLNESASMAFLGLSLTCARCHNHPLEKWTQNQYYGMASLFSRVQLKDGPAPGEVVVMVAPDGEIRHPRTGIPIPPAPLDAKPIPDSLSDRREAFADWLAQPDNPYFARAAVNRVWRNFFGRGLIEPEDDLRATNPPSDEPLLDFLVADFRAHAYNVKHLTRLIMNSAAYARSSTPLPNMPADPKFLSHYPVKRLPAEVLLDAIARVAEIPTSFPGYPAGWRSLQLPDSKVESKFLSSFGRPDRLNTCSCERSSDPSMAQALHLANGETINDKLRNPESAVSKALASKADDSEIIDRLFLSALSRKPTPAERTRLLKALADPTPTPTPESRRQAIEDLFWATLTGNEFLFNH